MQRALSALVEEGLSERSARQGEYFQAELRGLQSKHRFIAQVRGRGLMIGVSLDLSDGNPLNRLSRVVIDALSAKMVTSFVASRLLNEHGVIVPTSLTNEYVLRVFPPLNVTKEEIDHFIASFDRLCGSLTGYGQVLAETVGRFVGHRLSSPVESRSPE